MSDTEHKQIRTGVRITLVGALANILLIALKFVGGIFGHSQALIADGVHSISDLFTDAVVLFAFKAGRNRPDRGHPFGHARIETLASAFVGLSLLGVAVYIGIQSANSIYVHKHYEPGWMAVAIAALSVVSKEILFQYTRLAGRRIRSTSIMANAWHHRSDALSSLAVLAGVTAARIQPHWHILDSYAALLVSFFIVKVGIQTLRDALVELADTAPSPAVLEEIERCIRAVPDVENHHDLRVRTTGGLLHIEVHIVIDGALSVIQGHRIAKQVEAMLNANIKDLSLVIVHMDPDRDEESAEQIRP